MSSSFPSDPHKELWMAEPNQLPAMYFRWGWGTMVILRRDRVPEGIIGFASDISQNLYPIAGIHPDGYAAYESGDFGWMEGTRSARLYRLSPWTKEEIASNIACIVRENPYTIPSEEPLWNLLDELKLSADDCLFYENGEKEFSCEITGVGAEKVRLLMRYTVGGADQGIRPDGVWNFRRTELAVKG